MQPSDTPAPTASGSAPESAQPTETEAPAPTSLWTGLSSPILDRCLTFDDAALTTALGVEVALESSASWVYEATALECYWYHGADEQLRITQRVGKFDSLKETKEWGPEDSTYTSIKGVGDGALLEVDPPDDYGSGPERWTTLYLDVGKARWEASSNFPEATEVADLTAIMGEIGKEIARGAAGQSHLTTKLTKADPLNPRNLFHLPDGANDLSGVKGEPRWVAFGSDAAVISWERGDWTKPGALRMNAYTLARAHLGGGEKIEGIGDEAWLAGHESEASEGRPATRTVQLRFIDGGTAWELEVERAAKDEDVTEALKAFAKEIVEAT